MRIAVVEDDPEIRSLLSIMLTQRLSLPQPSLFSDGTSLVRAVVDDHSNFDVIIMDYRMPEMNGLDVAKMVRNHLAGAKIILTTGYDVREEAQDAGLLYLQKPFSMEDLTSILTQ
jgi:DNA-binding NtrC family response regulator